MNITPYNLSESTKISEVYLNNIINEGLASTIFKSFGKKAGSEVGKKVGKGAATTVSKGIKNRHFTARDVVDDVYKGIRGLTRAGMKVVDGAATGTGKLMREHPGKTALATTAVGALTADQVALDGKYTDHFLNITSNSDKKAFATANQKNIENAERNNMQKETDALVNIDKAFGTNRASNNQTNDAVAVLSRMSVTNPDDDRLKPFHNIRKALGEYNKRNAADIQESDEGVDIDALIRKANGTLDSRQDIPKVIVPPTTRTAMDKVTAIHAKGDAERQNPNTKIDPSDQSWSANLKDFAFNNPYLTAAMITIPVITYIISKYGASLIDSITGKDGDKVSGKEFVIVDNGNYLHSNGFSKTVSKDIAIFKSRTDAQNAINALNSVKKSGYKIEELGKVIG
jgi:hypothetical protein